MKRYSVHQQKPTTTSPPTLALFAGVLIIAGFCAAQHPANAEIRETPPAADSATTISVNKPLTGDDSLRLAIERLRIEAGRLRMEAASINDSVRSLEVRIETGSRTATDRKDTVQLLSREGANVFLESLRGKKRGSRERGYGGGIGPTPGIFVVNMRPVHDLLDAVSSGNDFKNITFPIEGNWGNFFLMGITGYGALGNGLRIGGCFHGGSKSFSTRVSDSTFSLELKTQFGGMLIEKAFISGSFNWFIGGLFGGSSFDVTPTRVSNSMVSNSQPWDAIPRKFSTVSAPALLLELHGGFTYTMINWFHVGIDLATPLFFSPSGFRTSSDQSITNGFITVNPGFRIRLILGNIG